MVKIQHNSERWKYLSITLYFDVSRKITETSEPPMTDTRKRLSFLLIKSMFICLVNVFNTYNLFISTKVAENGQRNKLVSHFFLEGISR